MDQAAVLQKFFQVLGDANRLRIIKCIGDAEKSVSEIVAETGLSQPLISHHLRILKNSGILYAKRSGPFIHYILKDSRILNALGLFGEIVSQIGREASIEDEEPMFIFPLFWNNFFKGDK